MGGENTISYKTFAQWVYIVYFKKINEVGNFMKTMSDFKLLNLLKSKKVTKKELHREGLYLIIFFHTYDFLNLLRKHGRENTNRVLDEFYMHLYKDKKIVRGDQKQLMKDLDQRSPVYFEAIKKDLKQIADGSKDGVPFMQLCQSFFQFLLKMPEDSCLSVGMTAIWAVNTYLDMRITRDKNPIKKMIKKVTF